MHSGKHFWRARRLQYIAGLALNKSQRYPDTSRQSAHHFRRCLKLLAAAVAEWKQVVVAMRNQIEEVAA